MTDMFVPFGRLFSFLGSRTRGLYNYGFDIINGATRFNNYGSDQAKLSMVLANPAVLKVFSLQCDLFSMGRVCVKDENGEEIANDPFIDLLKSPNPLTLTESQFLWDFMFWNMLGTSYTYVRSSDVGVNNMMYFLDPSKIIWPQEFQKMSDKMIFTPGELKALKKKNITYRYSDGTTMQFPYERMILSFDLTNGIGNFFKGPSRLDALYKIISNSEHVLDSENVNIRYTSKFMVGSEHQTGATTKLGLSEDEKTDIVNKIDSSDKNVYPVKAKVNIQRFVDDLAALQLPQEYLHQYFLIGNMYGIPRDVLEAYQSATYENQEKARAAHVNYTLEPKGNQFMDAFEVFFGYRQQKKNIVITWDHLPFVQVFENDRVAVKKGTVEVLNSLLQLGVPLDEVNKYLGTEFTIEKPEPAPGQTTPGADQGATGATEETAVDQGEGDQGGQSDQ